VITQTPIILQEFIQHYKNLLGTKHTSSQQPSLTNLYPTQNHSTARSHVHTGSADYLRLLIDQITLEEVKHMVFSLPKDKASGPDGYLIEFFQTYWNIMWDDVYRAITVFYYNRLDL
jgi:hypothetical protein